MSYSFEDFLNTVRIETGPVMTTNNLYWAEAFLNRKKLPDKQVHLQILLIPRENNTLFSLGPTSLALVKIN